MDNERATWQLRSGSPEKEMALINTLGVSAVVARILVGRGIDTPAAVQEFLDLRWEKVPSPWMLRDVQPAAARLAQAVQNQETVAIYGDYDVDGITATALLVKVLTDLGGTAMYYIPRRDEEGYGLHQEALAELAAESQVVVTVDCGITALAEAEFALDEGLDLIITDHHQPGEELPKALAVVNPNRIDCQYPSKELAGVGVAFKLAHAVALLVTDDARRADAIVKQYLDLVALGTVADVVPLRGENRILVHMGLERFATSSLGLGALLEVARLDANKLSTGNLAFGLAPRINALGRLDDATLGVRLLLTEDTEEARQLAQMLDTTNRERQAIEARVTEEAMALVEEEIDLETEWSIVLASPTWHPGVIGIVASRLVEKYHRPTILISLAEEPGKGSGRSIEGFDLHRVLQSLSPLLERFGGHKMAAGLSVRRELIPELRHGLNRIARAQLTRADLVPKLRIDAEVGLAEVNAALLAELDRLAPYGVGNPQPVLMAEALSVHKGFLVGKRRAHLKLLVSEQDNKGTSIPLEAIGFGMAERLRLVEHATRVDLAFQPKLNVWNGRTNIDLVLKDMRLPVEEVRQQYLHRCLEHYRQVTGSMGSMARFAWRQIKDEHGPIAQPEVVDWRKGHDKTVMLNTVLSMEGTTLLYVAKPGYAVDLAERLTQIEIFRGRVGILYGSMPTEARDALEAALKEGEVALVITADLVDRHLENSFDRLVLYHLPVIPAGLRYAWQYGSETLYLAYTAEDVARNQELWSRLYPGRKQLAQLYVALGRAGALKEAVEVTQSWCSQADVGLDWMGVCAALRIFSELELVQLAGPSSWEEAGSIGVTLLPSPKNKLDLTRSIGYNECVKRRDYLDHYGQWALETPISQFQGQEAWEKVLGA
ncbi:MAG: single-stranded-DNA-specific exonuclease RecJ [Firmicutes bacterium]|nr:single-stranded-DNA-specific exonuclease RecJ [Bacillota bacterium]